jgi:hypothetical protein
MHLHIIVLRAKQLIFELSWILLVWLKRKSYVTHWLVFLFQLLII